MMQTGLRGPSTMSSALAVNVAAAPSGPVASTFLSAGTVTSGGVVASTVIVNELLPVLSCASFALHVTRFAPSGNTSPECTVWSGPMMQTGLTGPSTMSSAEAVKVAAAPLGPVASTFWLPETVTSGGVVSSTVMAKELLPVLPCASFALHVTKFAPSGNTSPECTVWSGPTMQTGLSAPSTRSSALAVKVAAAPLGPVASTFWSPETVTSGGVVSSTVIVKLLLPVLSCASFALQVTRFAPSGNTSPECTVWSGPMMQTGLSGPSTMSSALAVKIAAAPSGPVASTFWSPETVTSGGVVSCTVTWKSACAWLFASSVAVHATVVFSIPNRLPDGGTHRMSTLSSTASV